MIGIHVATTDAAGTVEAIRQAEEAGVPAVWLTQAGVAPDSMAILAAAAAVTHRIKLGTSIIPTWPRPPVLIAQQTMAVEGLAPGRFRLGIGPGTAAGMEPLYGVRWRLPMTHLREYLTVLRALIHEGQVEYEGKFVKARARIASPSNVPVMASALSLGAFRVCGELADGAISWMCAWPYLRDAALPAMAEGAGQAGRETPPLIAHVPVCLSEDPEAVRAATRDQVGRYGQFPNYQAMFALAGYPDVVNGYPDGLIDNLVVSGDDATIAGRLNAILDEGADEIIAHPLYHGDDRPAYLKRFFTTVAHANEAVGAGA
jgi:F420-dependent oxidoreductase-like protein